ncbi:hypothetical protein OF829_12545 [Sphingomonas sp. LB-2]|nr:hypothetical protein [Sphingomonas caeni]
MLQASADREQERLARLGMDMAKRRGVGLQIPKLEYAALIPDGAEIYRDRELAPRLDAIVVPTEPIPGSRAELRNRARDLGQPRIADKRLHEPQHLRPPERQAERIACMAGRLDCAGTDIVDVRRHEARIRQDSDQQAEKIGVEKASEHYRPAPQKRIAYPRGNSTGFLHDGSRREQAHR